jgi:DnaJ-class molecular chaperone
MRTIKVPPLRNPRSFYHFHFCMIMNGGGAQTDRNGNIRRQTFRRCPYAVLNLPHGFDAPINGDRIRESYKRLSRLLHPDKRPTGKERDDAQELFIEIQHACK